MKTVLSLVLLVSYVKCSKILVVFPAPAPSHFILGNALARGLAEAGHDVTVISPYKDNNPPKKGKYRNVVLNGLLEDLLDENDMNMFDESNMNPFLFIPMMDMFGNAITEETFTHPNFQQFLKLDEHFDVVILEQFCNDGLKALAYHYKAPLILVSTMGANPWVNNLVDNPAPPSYIPELFLTYTYQMTFKERVVNWLFMILSELNRHLIFFPYQNKLMKKYFPNTPDLSILNYNASLVFLNSHESINQAVPRVPNMIDIGGFHVNPPKELPNDLRDFMDKADDGVVYFSMGSNIKPSDMSEDQRRAVLGALGKMKQKVLWKWDENDLPEKPDNVKISKWFPQQDVLAHPNIKLFITHGGLLSTTETIYHGVPVLAFPIFGDQKMNAAKIEMDGYGLSLDFQKITEEKITQALNSILNDPKYCQNAKRRSKLLHDRPIKPLDLAVYWTEFVIRHKGAPHLRVAGVDLPWYKYLLLDVISFVILVIAGSIISLCFVVKKICSAIRKKKEKPKTN